MDADRPLDTPRGVTRDVVSCSAPACSVPARPREDFAATRWRNAHLAEEASIAAAKAFADRWQPRSRASAGRVGARSLAEPFWETNAQDMKYGTFIEKCKRERANAIRMADQQQAAAAAAAKQQQRAAEAAVERQAAEAAVERHALSLRANREPDACSTCRSEGMCSLRMGEGEELDTPRSTSRTSHYEGEAEGTPRSWRQALDGERDVAHDSTTNGTASERRAAGVPSSRQPHGSSESATLSGGRWAVNAPSGAASARREAGIPTARLLERRHTDSPRRSTAQEMMHDARRYAPLVGVSSPSAFPLGGGSAPPTAWSCRPRSSCAGLEHHSSSCQQVRSERYADRRSRPPPARRDAAIGVWTLSTGAKAQPPSALLEFPCNSTARRPLPQRWYNTDGKHVVVV